MSGKNQFPVIFNWQSTDPRTNFRPIPSVNGSAPSGVAAGIMTGTNTIYSQIIDVSRMDNGHMLVSWTGTPTGNITIYTSDIADQWPSLSVAGMAQPIGTDGYLGVNFTQFGFKYLMLKYVNSSGSGLLSVNMELKDLN